MAILFGEALLQAIRTASTDQPVLIEDFLYARNVLMLAGAPGTGKSIVMTQLALASSTATPLFGVLPIPKPLSVYYLQLEGSENESYARIRRMQEKVHLNTQNLCWDFRKGLNLLDSRQADQLLLDIASWRPPDILILDPLYQCVFGEIAKELPSMALIRFVDLVIERFGCAVILNHHTHRESYAPGTGQKIEEEDPFYGSQWLKAYVDTSYLLKPISGKYKNRIDLLNKKDRHSACLKQLMLHFDPESDTVSLEVPPGQKSSGYERALAFLLKCRQENRTTHFHEIMEECGISAAHLHRIQLMLIGKKVVRCDKRDADNHLRRVWEPL